MKSDIYLLTKWFGSFLYSTEEGVLEKRLFPHSFLEIASRIEKIQIGEILQEEEDLLGSEPLRVSSNLHIIRDKEGRSIQEKMRKKPLVFDPRLKKVGIYTDLSIPENHSQFSGADRSLAPEKYGYQLELLKKAMEELATSKIKRDFSADDVKISNSVAALDDFNFVLNRLYERLEKWLFYYSIKPSPGLNKGELGFVEDKGKTFAASPDKETLKLFRNISMELRELEELREDIIKYIDGIVTRIAPNLSELLGSQIAGKLIARAGSLEKLARMPASKIQILGAEKALYASLKSEEKKPPKHGILFQFPLIGKAPERVRGKVARLVASRVSIAARADAFTNNKIATKLKIELEREVKNLEASKRTIR
jgi:nucleolar protein 56